MPCLPAQYEIRVSGRLGETVLLAFPRMRSVFDNGETLLSGRLPDQAALYGVLLQLDALGLELIEVRRCKSPELGDAASPQSSGCSTRE